MSEGSSSTPPMQNPKVTAMSKAFSQVDLDGHDLPPSPAPSSPRNGRQYSIATQLVYSEGNDQYNASSVPIYQVSMLPELGHTLLMK
jgi:cysteine-S-conjugate beta-lyase